MKKRSTPDIKEGNINLTPLIDVVMCLIVFYMLVAKIGIKTSADNPVELPTSVMGIDIKDFGNTVTLNVTASSSSQDEPDIMTLNPSPAGGPDIKLRLLDEAAPGTATAVTQNMNLVDFLTLLKGRNTEFRVIIRANRDLAYRYLEPVLISCAKAKVKDVNFATRKAEELVAQ